MKKQTLTLIALVLILVLTASVAYGEETAETTATAFAVQNLGGASTSVIVEFRDSTGTKTNTLTQPITAGENYNFDQRYASGDPGVSPFQGSVIVTAGEPIGAVANIMKTGGVVDSYESYNALNTSHIGQDIQLPQLLKNVSSAGVIWNTTIAIQNTDINTAAAVKVVFTPDSTINPLIGGTLTEPYTHTVSIPAGGSTMIDQSTLPGDGDIGANFFGSGRIISDRNVAPVVTADGGGEILNAFPSYASGTTDDIALPSIYKDIMSLGDSYSTAILIANFGDVDATVEIEYLPISGSYTVSGTDTVTVPAHGSKNIDQRYDAPSITSATFIGGAVIKSTNSQPIAANVNLRGGSRYGFTFGSLIGGGTTAFAPIAYKDISSSGYSWSSTIIVYNFDRSVGDATVNFTFYPASGTPIVDPTNYTVSDLSQFDLRYTTVIAADPTFIGAVKVTSVGDGRDIGVLVQTRGSGGTGDALLAFLGLTP